MKTPEGYEKADIRKYLNLIGAYVILPMTFGMGSSGHSDIIACWCGKFVSIEVKREGKEPSKLQEIRMQEVRAAGGVALWGTAEKVIDELKQLVADGILPRQKA